MPVRIRIYILMPNRIRISIKTMPNHMRILLKVLHMLENRKRFLLLYSNANLQCFSFLINGKGVMIWSIFTAYWNFLEKSKKYEATIYKWDNRCCGSGIFWCRSGSKFSIWFRSRSKSRAKWCGSDPIRLRIRIRNTRGNKPRPNQTKKGTEKRTQKASLIKRHQLKLPAKWYKTLAKQN